MEAHRNAWFTLALAATAVACVFLTVAVPAHGHFQDRPDAWWAIASGVVALLFFLMAVLQVRFPLLRGAEAALLYRALQKLHREILAVPPPTEEVERITDAARNEITRHAPHLWSQFEAEHIKSGKDMPPDTQLDYIRNGITKIMKHLEQGRAG